MNNLGVQNSLYACKSVPMQGELSLNFHRNNVYGHLEQVWLQNQLSELKVKVDTCSRDLFQVPIYVISVKIQW